MHKFILLLSLFISQVSLAVSSPEKTKTQLSKRNELSACSEVSEGAAANAGATAGRETCSERPAKKPRIKRTLEVEECVVCQEEKIDELVLSCGHSFCRDCVLKWFKKSPDCPLCRSNQGVFYNVLLLNSDNPRVQLRAARTLANRAKHNQEYKNAIREAGAIPPLTNLLSSGDTYVQQFTAFALGNLAKHNQENKMQLEKLVQYLLLQIYLALVTLMYNKMLLMLLRT